VTVWLAVDVLSEDGRTFEVLGVFDTEAGADAACTKWNHAMFPLTLNERLSDESVVAPGVRYPLSEERP